MEVGGRMFMSVEGGTKKYSDRTFWCFWFCFNLWCSRWAATFKKDAQSCLVVHVHDHRQSRRSSSLMSTKWRMLYPSDVFWLVLYQRRLLERIVSLAVVWWLSWWWRILLLKNVFPRMPMQYEQHFCFPLGGFCFGFAHCNEPLVRNETAHE